MNRRGAGLIEVLLASFLLLSATAPLSDLLRRSADLEARVRDRLSQEVRARGRLADLLASGTAPDAIVGLSDGSTRIEVREVSPGLVAVEASVTWTDGSGRVEVVRAARLVARTTVALEAVRP